MLYKESMELVELWLCDLVILLNNGRSGGSGNVCSSRTLGSDDGGGGGGGGIIELASLLVELGSLVLLPVLGLAPKSL